jgi:hypothetical protein
VQSHTELQVAFCADCVADFTSVSSLGKRILRFWLLGSESVTVRAHSRLNDGSVAGVANKMLDRCSGDVSKIF